MKTRRGAAVRIALSALLCVALVVGFSVYSLAAGKRAHEPGDCCVKPATPLCTACNGAWLCADPDKPGTCSCSCTPAAADYGCPWDNSVCE